MHHDLQISRLRALLAVVELGGFRRAAEALHVTQPAVSQQIRHLGVLIKQPVFVSTGRDLQLSPKGEELLGYARRIVSLNDDVVARFLPPVGTARLRLGVSNQLAEALPDILGALTTKMPDAQVRVQTGLSETLEGELAADRLDMALLLQRRHQRTATNGYELGRLRMDWFGRPSAGNGAPLPLTLFSEPCALRGDIMQTLDASDVPWRVGYECSELVGLRAATKAGLGVACLVANGDELWGLDRSNRSPLPPPPGPLPVTVAVTPAAAIAGFAPVAKRALQSALRAYPFVD